MNAAMALPGNSDRTFLTHLLARGLEDERYVVERFQAMIDGDIRRMPADEPAKKSRRKAKRTTVSLKDVLGLRPARNEIIVCTGLSIRGSGIQYWGSVATGLLCDRKQRG
ncbi:MAG: hypothetical protein OXM58_20915 [Rhodospirillaceae bacterium]|nr:hypothetical protein [Rhodospirillaceae bacterium]MDE0617111.1 hypothetical protein [Rhodospirillaceae bacterium]